VKSKTDQAGDGHAVLLSKLDDDQLCPVKWFKIYDKLRDQQADTFFYHIGEPSKPLSGNTPNHIVKKFIRGIGLDDETFGSHSCRRGGCTSAIEAGLDIRTVARHGRWRSSAINTYIVDSKETKLSVSKSIIEQ